MEANLHKEPIQIEVQSLTQVMGYALVLILLLVAKSWHSKWEERTCNISSTCQGRVYVIREYETAIEYEATCNTQIEQRAKYAFYMGMRKIDR